MVCYPVHFKSHWLWALLLLDERVGIILDPLVSHTDHKGHKEIFRKIWLWREAVVVNDIAPRLSPPLVVSLEVGRRRRVADILEMGGSGSVSETKKRGLGDLHFEGTATERWIGVRDLYAGYGHCPHKGMVSVGFDECGGELGEEGKGMVLEGDPRKYDQSPSWTLRSVWRG